MIKKTYLMILSVAIVSVLLGSLLANNMIMAQTESNEYDPWIDLNDDGTIDARAPLLPDTCILSFSELLSFLFL